MDGWNDFITTGRWEWQHSGKAVTYFNWGDGQPSKTSSDENCLLTGLVRNRTMLYLIVQCFPSVK